MLVTRAGACPWCLGLVLGDDLVLVPVPVAFLVFVVACMVATRGEGDGNPPVRVGSPPAAKDPCFHCFLHLFLTFNALRVFSRVGNPPAHGWQPTRAGPGAWSWCLVLMLRAGASCWCLVLVPRAGAWRRCLVLVTRAGACPWCLGLVLGDDLVLVPVPGAEHWCLVLVLGDGT